MNTVGPLLSGVSLPILWYRWLNVWRTESTAFPLPSWETGTPASLWWFYPFRSSVFGWENLDGGIHGKIISSHLNTQACRDWWFQLCLNMSDLGFHFESDYKIKSLIIHPDLNCIDRMASQYEQSNCTWEYAWVFPQFSAHGYSKEGIKTAH